MSDCALITVIEGNKSINSKDGSGRLLEAEAIKCFKSWRKNAGKLKDIDIYSICCTNNTPSSDTISLFKDLNIHYIHEPCKESLQLTNGWWCKPLGCSILEKKLSYEYFIHIDLDMYLYRELDVDYRVNSCLIYDGDEAYDERQCTGQNKLFNTCFMTAKRVDYIFSRWWEELQRLEESFVNDTDYWRIFFKDISYDKLEEGALDVLQNKTNLLISLDDIMFGETYTSLHKKNIKNIYFHHYHIYDKPALNKYNYLKDKILYQKLIHETT